MQVRRLPAQRQAADRRVQLTWPRWHGCEHPGSPESRCSHQHVGGAAAQMRKQIRTLENRLEGACHRHNARRAETRALRAVVDSLRRERLALDEGLRKLQRGLATHRRALAGLLQEVCFQRSCGWVSGCKCTAWHQHVRHGTASRNLDLRSSSCRICPIRQLERLVQAHAAGAGGERAQAQAAGLKVAADREQANAEAEWRQLTQLLEHVRQQRVLRRPFTFCWILIGEVQRACTACAYERLEHVRRQQDMLFSHIKTSSWSNHFPDSLAAAWAA